MGKVPDFEKAKEYSLSRLEHELSPRLTYHNLEHTARDVVPAVDRLATLEKVEGEDRLLLLTAAYYHDLGFIQQRQGHESISIQMAEDILPVFGYAKFQVDVIRGIIQATVIPQSPASLMEKIMADADLDYLGQENFWQRSEDLRLELENFGQRYSEEDWLVYQVSFIEAHHYFTISQRSSREAGKQQHLLELKERLIRAAR